MSSKLLNFGFLYLEIKCCLSSEIFTVFIVPRKQAAQEFNVVVAR
jgi:hypothetical protein